MPYSIETEDGIVIDGIPDDVDPNSDQLKMRVQQERFKRDNADVMTSSPKAGIAQGDVSPGFTSVSEPLMSLGSGAIAEPLAGIAGLFQSLNPFAPEGAGAQTVEDVRNALTYAPKTEAGKRGMQAVGETLAPVVEPLSKISPALGEKTLELTGSPMLATAAHTAPAALLEWLGFKGARMLQGDVKLKNPDGTPTPELREALQQKGITYEALQPEVANQIPEVAPRTTALGRPDINPAEVAAQDIQAGGRQSGLAPLQVAARGGVEADPLGKRAVRQGFEEGVVQVAKQATPETQKAMDQMLSLARQTKALPSISLRPSDIVGQSAVQRVKFIRNTIDEANKDLTKAAQNLKGKPVDPSKVGQSVGEALDNLNVRIFKNQDGGLDFDFAGSIIQEDKTSQRMIKSLVRLMENARNDAYGYHQLKRQIDSLVDYNKASQRGITASGERTLKSVRKAINDTLREMDPEYAKANDTLSRGINILDELDSNTAKKIDIYDDKALGQELRKIFSNYQTRINLDRAIEDMDTFVRDFSPEGNPAFKDSVRDLALFANALDRKFGAVARTSLQGTIDSALQAATGAADIATGGKAGMIKEGVKWAGRKLGDLEGINDENAFAAMEELLKRGYK